jgi:hypothetical protein
MLIERMTNCDDIAAAIILTVHDDGRIGYRMAGRDRDMSWPEIVGLLGYVAESVKHDLHKAWDG